jgi:hypothetical protein
MLRAMQDIIRSERKLAANAAKLAAQTGISVEKAKAQLKDQIRQQVLDIAKGLDPAVRGKVLNMIAKADTWQKANRAVERLAAVAEVFAGRKSHRRLRNMLKLSNLKGIRGLDEATREKLIGEVPGELGGMALEAEEAAKVLRKGVIQDRRVKKPMSDAAAAEWKKRTAEADAETKRLQAEFDTAKAALDAKKAAANGKALDPNDPIRQAAIRARDNLRGFQKTSRAELRAFKKAETTRVSEGAVSFRDIMAARKILETLEDAAALEIAIARNKFKEIKGLRGETAETVVKAAIEKITGKKNPIDTRGRLVDAALKLPAWMNLNGADLRTILARIEGSEGPLFNAIYKVLRDADTRRSTLQREMLKEATQVAQDAGFKDFQDAQTQLSSFAGSGATRLLEVRINGETVKLTLGQALDLYGHYTDPATSALITRGLEAVPEGGEDTAKIAPTPNDAIALKLALEAEQKGITKFIDGAKKVANKYFPERQKAIYRLTGKAVIEAISRWRRDRFYKNKPIDKVPTTGREYTQGLLESIGTNIERVETAGVPLLLRSPADKLMDDMRETADIVAMAEPIRGVMNILENEELTKAVSARHPRVMKALNDIVTATFARAPMTYGGATANFIKQNAAVSLLALNLSSIAVNLAGGVRALPDVRPQDFIAAKKDVLTNGLALFADLKERSGYFHERYNTAAKARISMVGTSPKEVPAVRSAARALRAMVKNVKSADVGTAFMDLRDVTGASLELYNLADAPLSVDAYAAKIRESKAIHKGWTEEQHRDWAAVEAEQIVRDTQPGHGAIDAGLLPMKLRGDLLSTMFMLTSDVFRARNRINLAFHKSYAYGTKVLAAESLNMALGIGARVMVGYAMKSAFLAMMGGDDDDQRKLFEETFEGKGMLKQFALNAGSMSIPVVGSQITTFVGGFGGESAAMAPGQRMVSDALNSASTVSGESYDALERWLEGRPIRVSRLLRAWSKALNDVSSAMVGNPFRPIIRQAMDAAKRAE